MTDRAEAESFGVDQEGSTARTTDPRLAYYVSTLNPRGLKAYDDGYEAGIKGLPSYPHPWSGKQTNFNKPLIEAWESGRKWGEKVRFSA